MPATLRFETPVDTDAYTETFRTNDGEKYVVTCAIGNGHEQDGYSRNGSEDSPGRHIKIEWKNGYCKHFNIIFYNRSWWLADKVEIVRSFKRWTTYVLPNETTFIFIEVVPIFYFNVGIPSVEKPDRQKLSPVKEEPILPQKKKKLPKYTKNVLKTGILSDVVLIEKYDVQDLREKRSAKLKSLDLSNALDTLLFAEVHSDQILKKAALCFISKNCSQLKVMRNWDSFMEGNHSLAIEILNFVIDGKL